MPLTWNTLTTLDQLEEIAQRSYEVPCLLFKHSTRCEISAIAKYRLENDWAALEGELEPYFLDLLQFRAVSQAIAERFEVYHESPQVLLLRNGECVYDASHLDISVSELLEVSAAKV